MRTATAFLVAATTERGFGAAAEREREWKWEWRSTLRETPWKEEEGRAGEVEKKREGDNGEAERMIDWAAMNARAACIRLKCLINWWTREEIVIKRLIMFLTKCTIA